MVTGKTPELSAKDLTPERMDQMSTQLSTLFQRSQELADTNPAVGEQIAKLTSNGLTQVRQAKLHLDMGMDPQKVIEAMNSAVDFYNQGVTLRKELIHQKLRDRTGPSLETDFTAMQEMLAPGASKDDIRIVALTDLKELAKNLDKEQNNPFFRGFKNSQGKDRIEVNFALVNKARADIAALRKAGINDPIFDKIEGSLGFIESVDPIRSGYNQMNQTAAQMKGTFDWKPLRIVGAIGGLVVTAFGLGSAALTGEMPSWPTALWAGLLAVSTRPDILANNKTKAIQTLQDLQAPTVANIMTVGKFAGDKGAEAFAELRKLSKDGKLKDVRGLPSLNQAQVALVAGEGSTLTNVLNSFPDDVSRSRALGVLDMQVQKGNGELMEEIIRTKGKV